MSKTSESFWRPAPSFSTKACSRIWPSSRLWMRRLPRWAECQVERRVKPSKTGRTRASEYPQSRTKPVEMPRVNRATRWAGAKRIEGTSKWRKRTSAMVWRKCVGVMMDSTMTTRRSFGLTRRYLGQICKEMLMRTYSRDGRKVPSEIRRGWRSRTPTWWKWKEGWNADWVRQQNRIWMEPSWWYYSFYFM